MSSDDFPFAIDITNLMGWSLTRADFEFMLKLEPEGSFVLLDDSEKVGITTTVSFGQLGWFGNLIVSGDRRKKGGGSMLVNHALGYLRTKKVKTIGLYAYTEAIPFYTRLGFKYDSDFTVLKGAGLPSSVDNHTIEARRRDLEQIVEFDRNYFGADRKKVLEPILTDPRGLCYIVCEYNQLVGFVMAATYGNAAELGPMVCSYRRRDIAISLINAALNKLKGYDVSLCIHNEERSVIDMLVKHGFCEDFRVSRMFLGTPIDKPCIYAAESLERG